jgi:Na+-transporting methylmalonyl-CoA/oxaloacetate decarboxylase beta subunit
MDNATQAAFDEANAKIDTLIAAVATLATDVVEEKKALDVAIGSPGDGPTIIAAARALSAKLDGAIANAQAALAAVAPPAPNA